MAEAILHTLADSSLPGAVPPIPAPLSRVGLAPRRGIIQLSDDAEVIDLAGRVVALANRRQEVLLRIASLDDRVTQIHPRPPRPMSNEVFRAYDDEIRPTQDRLGLIRLRKVRRRMAARLERWTLRLAAMELSTMAGLSAKATASLAAIEDDKFDLYADELSASVIRDAVRLATSSERDTLRIATASADHADADLCRMPPVAMTIPVQAEPTRKPDRRALEAYREFLWAEGRLLGLELFPELGDRAERCIPANTAAAPFHRYPMSSGQAPSDRAERMCAVLGIDWTMDEPKDDRGRVIAEPIQRVA